MFLSLFCCGKLCKFLSKYLLVKENPFLLIETISNNYTIPVTNEILHTILAEFFFLYVIPILILMYLLVKENHYFF